MFHVAFHVAFHVVFFRETEREICEIVSNIGSFFVVSIEGRKGKKKNNSRVHKKENQF